MSQKKEKKNVVRRFWKPCRDLPSVEWNKRTEKPDFQFVKGFFETTDQALAERLIKLGYEEVGLDEQRPPVPPQVIQRGALRPMQSGVRPILMSPAEPVTLQQIASVKADQFDSEEKLVQKA